MGATFSIVLYGYDLDKMTSTVNAAFDEARRLDAMLSNYKPASEWNGVNRNAARKPVRVSPELFRLLATCMMYSRQSEGAFDISVGPLMKLWGFYDGPRRVPDRTEILAALSAVGYEHVHLDNDRQTVSFDRSGVEMDPGGVGKGYAVDRIVDILRQNGFRTALVSGSGSSIYGMGAPPDHPKGWQIQIMDPWHTESTVAAVFLKDMSISTSGSYEKFFRSEGQTYSHIMDPRTGYPAQGSVSVSVVAPRTLDSEVWAKPYFVNGRQWTVTHKPKDFKVFFCENKSNRPCTWLP